MAEAFERVGQSALHLKEEKFEVGVGQISTNVGAPSRVKANRWERQLRRRNAVCKHGNSNAPTTQNKNPTYCAKGRCAEYVQVECITKRNVFIKQIRSAQYALDLSSMSGEKIPDKILPPDTLVSGTRRV